MTETTEETTAPVQVGVEEIRRVVNVLRPFFDEPAVLELAITRFDLAVALRRLENMEAKNEEGAPDVTEDKPEEVET